MSTQREVGGSQQGRAVSELLPAPDAPDADYTRAADELEELSTEDLVEVLLEVRRRQDAGVGDAQALAQLEASAQALLGERRLQQVETETRTLEARQPLRRRLLVALGERPATPTELSERLSVRKETVSRALADLAASGLVVKHQDDFDRRRWAYSMTAVGESALARHRSFGEPTEREGQIDNTEAAEFLGVALQEAVRVRREESDFEDAISRLRGIVEEAEELNDPFLALRARHELATTLRQAGRSTEFAAELEALAEIAAGRRVRLHPDCVLPANGYLEYEYGRRRGRQADRASLEAREAHLHAAQAIFSRGGLPSRFENWREREAWTWTSLADVYRELSQLPSAISAAERANELFMDIDDPYGRSRCLLLIGFFERLRGNFNTAWESLIESYSLADEGGFERFQAYALLQMGETQRARGELSDAHEYLSEANSRAQRMDMNVVVGFALSAIGATSYAQGDLGDAVARLQKANSVFNEIGHQDGKALAVRRLFVALSRSSESARSAHPNVRELLADATNRYSALHSPAGLAECYIDAGWIEIREGHNPGAACEHLLELTSGGSSRWLIEFDPWAPPLLYRFAMRVGRDDLITRAHDLLGEGHTRNAVEAEAVLDMAAEPLRDLSSPV